MRLQRDYFVDTEIISYLDEYGDEGQQAVKEFLHSLLSIYQKSINGKSLTDILTADWHLLLDKDSVERVMELLESPLHPNDQVDYISDYRYYLDAWRNVKTEVKTRSRFFCQMDSVNDVLEEFDIDSDSSYLFKDNIFFRARIHHEDEPVFSIENMGCPQTPEKATAGRANPKGIGYLYLCCDKVTPFYEVRPDYLDRVDIGTFRIIEDNVKVVDFTERVNLFSVYYDDGEEAFMQKVKRRVLFDAISNDLSRPLRSFDSELEYIPTQYICEYFKARGADGIIFKSSVYESGKNLVLFYPEKAECINVCPYVVNKIEIGREQLQLSEARV